MNRRWQLALVAGLLALLATLLALLILWSGRGAVELDPQIENRGPSYGKTLNPLGLCRAGVNYRFHSGTVRLVPLEPDPLDAGSGLDEDREVSFTAAGNMWSAAAYQNLPPVRGRKYRLRMETKVIRVFPPGQPTDGPAAELVVAID